MERPQVLRARFYRGILHQIRKRSIPVLGLSKACHFFVPFDAYVLILG